MTLPLGPRPLTPRDGLNWLREGWQLLLSRPQPFVGAALLAPVASAFLLMLPIWDVPPHVTRGWLPVLTTIVCYGLPLCLAVCLASGLARAAGRRQRDALGQLLVPTVLKVLFRASLFLFTLLAQGYLAVYLIQDLINPGAFMAADGDGVPTPNYFFGVTDTILGTQLNMIGCLLLVLQLLFACFVPPLQLFRELSVATAWRLSFRAMQLNPWLGPALGLSGLAMILVSYFQIFSLLAQVLALPLPAYLGAVLYAAWKDVFQGGVEDELEDAEEKLAIREIAKIR